MYVIVEIDPEDEKLLEDEATTGQDKKRFPNFLGSCYAGHAHALP